ncbi:MAG TPA: sugar phosphate isomerase/epimerase [Anaerolineaceae bacterium]|nr:sugar phosphate isomerase/epimerase [Anaerolineaceae bacterium]
MRIGVISVLYQNLTFEEALEKICSAGVTAIEIGVGGYPGSHHCKVDELLESAEKRKAYLEAVRSRGMIISAFSCHNEPLSPNQSLARESDEVIKKALRLASLCEVPVVNMFSGLPAGSPGDTSPNWITCPWPPHFLEMLDYQWNLVAIPYWTETAKFAARQGVKIGIEMHPGMLIYNVETMLRMREAVGPALGCNFDPSHLFWNGVDPVAAIRRLGDAIVHVHGKDCYVDSFNVSVNGCNDHKPYTRIPQRAWTFRTIGFGHDVKVWKDIASALRMVGYDYVISIEHEDGMMSVDEGLSKAIAVLKEAVALDPPGVMFWA